MGYDWEQRLRITVDAIKSKRFKNFERDMKSGTLWADKSVKAGLISQKRDNDALVASIEGRYKKEQNLIKKTDKQQFQSGENRARIMDYEFKKQKDLIKKTDKQQFQSGEVRASILNKEIKHRKNYNDAVAKEQKRFKGEYMGLMFGGMALQRAFGGLLKTLISDYKALTKESLTPLGESLIGLEANWKFLKFAMVDASGPLITKITDMMSNLATTLAKTDPALLTKIFGAIGGLAVVGGIASVFGQGALFFTSIASAAAFKSGVTEMKGMIAGTSDMDGNKLDKGTAFFGAMGKIAGGIVLAFSIKDFLDSINALGEKNYGDALMSAATSALGFVAGAKLVKGGKGAGVWATGYIALKLLSEDMLGKSIYSIVGTIVGFFNGLVWAAGIAGAKIKHGLFGWTGAYQGITKDLAQIDLSTAFGFGFKKGFASQYEAGQALDELTSSLKENLNAGKTGLEGQELALDTIITKWNGVGRSAKDYNRVIAIDLPKTVYDFINDDTNGMNALKQSVVDIRKEAEKGAIMPITIKYQDDLGQGISMASVNPGTATP